MKKSIMFIISIFILSGCGGGESSTTKNSIDKTPLITTNIDKTSKAYFGTLAEATVNIYQLGEGDKRLLFTEKTSTGSTMDEIGNFNAHFDELKKNKFYQYEVIGGKNWDADKDGNLDSQPTNNEITYRAINRGIKSHVKWWSVNNSSKKGGSSESLE
jgi:hypothetical protein